MVDEDCIRPPLQSLAIPTLQGLQGLASLLRGTSNISVSCSYTATEKPWGRHDLK